MNEWLLLSSFEDWSQKLDTLLEAAEAAASADSDPGNAARRDAAARLRDFRRFCPDRYGLDPIATKAIDGLVDAVLAESLRQLANASADLDALVKPIREITTESNRRAGWLSLKTPTAIVERLEDTVEAIDAVKETTADLENAEEIGSRVDSVVRALKRLREEVENAVE